MKKLMIITSLLLCGCLQQFGNTSSSAEAGALEVTDVEIRYNSGSGVEENVSVSRVSLNPPCFRFTRDAGKPGPVRLTVGWERQNSEESIDEVEVATQVLKRGESETVCFPLPKNTSGKIVGSFVFYPNQ